MIGQTSPRRILAFTCAVLTWGATIQAKTICVNAEGTGDFPTIRAATDAAENGDVIVLEQGTYRGYGNHDIKIVGKELTVRSRDPNDPAVVDNTIIDCQGYGLSTFYAFWASPGEKNHLTIQGLLIHDGNDVSTGGAVRCELGELDVINCAFVDNTIDLQGGAIYSRGSKVRIRGCTFSNNTSELLQGGAIYCKTSQVEVSDCSFEDSTGTALETWDCQVTVTDCTFQNNQGENGGAIYSRADTDPVSTCLTLTRCTFTSNSVSALGGALYVHGGKTAIQACTFTLNKAGENGGALCNYRSSSTVSNCVFAGNIATADGGAIHNVYNSSPEIINCTFVANEAACGGAVSASGGSNPLVSHSILWSNRAPQGASVWAGTYRYSEVQTATATVEYCDVEGDGNRTYAESGSEVRWGAGNLATNPVFVEPTRGDYHLCPSSPCIDAGDPKYNPKSDETDRDGRARRRGSAVDMGAYEGSREGLGPVYRFWSPTKSKHFYTIWAGERDKLINQYSQVWSWEGTSYCTFYQPVEANLVPVYRFWSDKLSSHFYTISEEERQKTINDYPGVWTYEGVVFYAYPPGRQPLGALPVYRFWSNRYSDHLYTISEDEKNKLIRNYPQDWQFEGVAWCAYPTVNQPEKAIYDFTGGSQEASYVLTLGACVDGKEALVSVPDLKLSTSSTWMQMTIDFDNLSATLDRLQIKTAVTQYNATILQIGAGVVIPFSLSAQGTFGVSSSLGPFVVDPTTGLFADFARAGQSLEAKDTVARYFGSVRLGDQVRDFNLQGAASRFAPEATGTFTALELLPAEIQVSLPFTFQWHRQNTKDLLVETSVNGHLVQVYVTAVYAGTQGLWKGQITK